VLNVKLVCEKIEEIRFENGSRYQLIGVKIECSMLSKRTHMNFQAGVGA